jgi:hypothetical protein
VRNSGVAPKPHNRSHLSMYWCPSYQYRVTQHKPYVRWDTPPVLFPAHNETNLVHRADYSPRRYFENYGCFWSLVHPKWESCYQRRALYRWWLPVEESGLSPCGGYRLVMPCCSKRALLARFANLNQTLNIIATPVYKHRRPRDNPWRGTVAYGAIPTALSTPTRTFCQEAPGHWGGILT